MLLRKRPRPRPNMRRTTSMGGITLAVEADKEPSSDVPHQQVLQHDHPPHPHDMPMDPPANRVIAHAMTINENDERFVMSPSSSSTSSSSSSSSTTATTTTNANSFPYVMPTPHFLRTCRLCKRSLAPGRDIYMYRGDRAFCSLECREKQMKQDEKKQKWKVASNKDVRSANSPPTAPSDDPTNTKTIVAASTR